MEEVTLLKGSGSGTAKSHATSTTLMSAAEREQLLGYLKSAVNEISRGHLADASELVRKAKDLVKGAPRLRGLSPAMLALSSSVQLRLRQAAQQRDDNHHLSFLEGPRREPL